MTLDYDESLLPTLSDDGGSVRWPDGVTWPTSDVGPMCLNLIRAHNAEKAAAERLNAKCDDLAGQLDFACDVARDHIKANGAAVKRAELAEARADAAERVKSSALGLADKHRLLRLAAEKRADRAISVTKELSEKVYDLEHAVTTPAEARSAVDSVDPRALCVLGLATDGRKRILVRAEDLADGERWIGVTYGAKASLDRTSRPAPAVGFIQVAERTPEPETVTLTISRRAAQSMATYGSGEVGLAARRALEGEARS
jgi:hypothetical protein